MNQTHIKALERAADLLGGIPELARHMGIPGTTLILMMDGTVAVPSELFTKVVDIIISGDLSAVTAPMVLVVEDDPATAYSFSRLIRQLGYQVETATDGQSALDRIRASRPVVAFVDLRLPDISGWHIAEIVKAEGLSTRIVAVTAYGSTAADRERSIAAGFEEHFGKPVDLAHIRSIIPQRTPR